MASTAPFASPTESASPSGSAHPTRRNVLAGAAAALAPLALGGLPGVAAAEPTSTEPFVADDPRLRPYRGMADGATELRCDALAVTGRWPRELVGRFWRNGPALFERGGERYRHWFDGDGMVQRFTIGPRGIAHVGRFVQTPKLQAEQRAGRFLRPAFGTRVERSEGDEPAAGPDAGNTANTNAVEHAGRLLALWEGGSAIEMDPATLATRGPVTWGEGLAQMPFSAHPKIDADGHLWNIGTFADRLVAWHVDPAGRLVRAQATTLPVAHPMAHDVAITRRWIVLPLGPLTMDYAAVARGEPVARAFRFDPAGALRVVVMAKDDVNERRVFELPPRMVFHVGNAHEAADGTVVLSYVGASDHGFLVRDAVGLLAGHSPRPLAGAAMEVARLDMRTGRATVETLPGGVEFPRVDPRRIGLATRHVATAAHWARAGSGGPDRRGGLLHGVQMQDLQTGRVDRHDYGADAVAEEHVLVPRPGGTGERDGWLLGTRYDARRGVTVLAAFDAARVAAGPIAEAALPYALPLGFHGHFTPT